MMSTIYINFERNLKK